MRVCAVVPAHQRNAFSDSYGRVAQQMDARLAIKSFTVFLARIVIMVAQAGINGRIETSKFGRHARFEQRLNAEIDNITRNEHRIGMLGIDEIHPFCQVVARVVIAQVHIAQQHKFDGLGERLA